MEIPDLNVLCKRPASTSSSALRVPLRTLSVLDTRAEFYLFCVCVCEVDESTINYADPNLTSILLMPEGGLNPL